MDEDFQSFIVDPNLVDQGIDVSGLKTQTSTRPELLFDLPEFSGIKVDSTRDTYIQDMYKAYGGGLPMLPEPVVDTPVVDTPVIDTPVDNIIGPTLPGFDSDSPKNTDFEQNLIDQGIGVQGAVGDPVVAPGEMPLTQDDFDAFNEIAVTPVTPIDTSIAIEDLTQPGSIEDFQITAAPSLTNQTQITDPVTPIQDLPMVTTSVNRATGEVFDAQTGQEIGNLYDEVALTGTGTPEQQEGFLQNVLGKTGQTVDNALNELGKVPGAVVDFANQTVDIFGKQLNVGKTLAVAAVNKVVGAPISLVFDLVGALGFEGGRGDVSDALAEKYGRDDIGRLTTGVMAGYSVGPNFTETVQERIDDIKNRKAPQTDASRKTIEELETIKAEAIAAGSSGVVTEPGTVVGPGEMPVTQEEIDAFNAPPPDINIVDEVSLTGEDDSAPSGPPEGPGITADDAFGGDGPSDASASDAQAAANQDAARGGQYGGGNGSSGGGGKIVCTMMNESYGFGSFRNKIWLRHSKNLAPEYQIGYHKIFLPLVRLSKTNKILKKILEHIAVHRTIDIRQESRGKMHVLGRIYRKILEPICYWVGKYAKR